MEPDEQEGPRTQEGQAVVKRWVYRLAPLAALALAAFKYPSPKRWG